MLRYGRYDARAARPTIDAMSRSKRLLILWFALAFVVWNGVYDMRMHDTMRGYLLEAALAQAGLGRGVDMRTDLHRGLVDAVAFSTAWAWRLPGGMITMRPSPLDRRRRSHVWTVNTDTFVHLSTVSTLAPHR